MFRVPQIDGAQKKLLKEPMQTIPLNEIITNNARLHQKLSDTLVHVNKVYSEQVFSALLYEWKCLNLHKILSFYFSACFLLVECSSMFYTQWMEFTIYIFLSETLAIHGKNVLPIWFFLHTIWYISLLSILWGLS